MKLQQAHFTFFVTKRHVLSLYFCDIGMYLPHAYVTESYYALRDVEAQHTIHGPQSIEGFSGGVGIQWQDDEL